MDLGISGLASGFDWKSFLAQIAEVDRAPQSRLLQEQTTLSNKKTAYGAIQTNLEVLRNKVADLKNPELFSRRVTSSADESVATASATGSAALSSYKLNVTQLATASKQVGTANVGAALSPSNDVSGLTLSDAAFGTAVKAGNFTVNGKQVELETSDTLQDVFDKISSATGGTVTASYDPATDKISLSGAGTIVLGSATDSSNFLTVAKLHNNGTGNVESSAGLGSVKTSAALNNANLATAITDGGAGAGEFKINGVSIAFDAGADSLKNVMDRINASGAGVTASYDAVNDRMQLTNNVAGDLGVGLEDVSGNFLAATGLSGGALSRGDNLEYSINDGGTFTSHSNTIDEDTSGIAGLTISALSVGETTIGVKSDGAAIKKAINDFIASYNQVQGKIETETASSTDAKGLVTAGTLSGEFEAFDIASRLRGISFGGATGLDGAINHLNKLGIDSNGDNNNLTLTDAAALDAALENNLDEVAKLFTDSTNGLGVRLDAFLESTVGDDGTLTRKQERITTQVGGIDTQIADLEKVVQANQAALTSQFVAMEQAQQQINQQLAYLQKQLGV